MNIKNILIIVVALAIFGGIIYTNKSQNNNQIPETQSTDDTSRVMPSNPETEVPTGKLKVTNFSGKIEEVNTGCYADGECYAVIGGKHVTTMMGWTNATVGKVLVGNGSLEDLKKNMGREVEVYAKDNGDGTYTLYGSEGFYIKLK